MMKIIKKHKQGDSISSLKELSNSDKEALFWVFIKNKGNYQQKDRAIVLAEFMKDKEAWLQCDCSQSSPPIMTVGLSIKGNYYLQRINTRGAHEEKCVFKGVDQQYTARSNGLKPPNKSKPLLLHRRGHVESQSPTKGKKSTGLGRGEQQERLSRTMYAMITDSGLNKLSILGKETISDRFKSLRQAAKNYTLAKGINAYNYLWTYPDVEQAISRLEENKNRWPKGSRPYAICIAIADKIEDKTLYFNFKEKKIEVKLSGTIKASSGRLGDKSAPYLVLFTITDTMEEEGVYKPFDAFYVPVYSKSQLIPVDSRYERMVLEKIAQRAKWWVKDKKLTASVLKPLFDIEEFSKGEIKKSKPDFLIETPNDRIIFEVMGSHEDTYIERKKRTVGFMEAIGEVIEFDALEADKSNNWDESLNNKIRKLSALVFKGNNS